MANQLASFFASIGFKVDKDGLKGIDEGFAKAGAASKKFADNLRANTSKSMDDLKRMNNLYRMKEVDELEKQAYREKSIREKLADTRQKAEAKAQAVRDSVRAKDYDSHIYAYRKQQEKLQREEDKAFAGAQARADRAARIASNATKGSGGGKSGSGGLGDVYAFGKGAFGGGGIGGYAAMHGKLSYLLEGLGVATVAKTSFEVANFNQGLAPVFKFVTGSSKQAAEEVKFVRQESDRLGLSYIDTANAYKKMFASTYRSMGVEGSRKLFTGFSEMGTLLGLGDEQMKRVFVALGQQAGKGQIMSEEVKSQLGDALPAAEQLYADALEKGSVAVFQKNMKAGKYHNEDLLKVAEYVYALKKEGLEDVLTSQGRQLARLKNSWVDLFTAINRAGLDQGQRSALVVLTDIIKSSTPAIAGFTAGIKSMVGTLVDGWDRLGYFKVALYLLAGGLVAYFAPVTAVISGTTLAFATLFDLVETLQGKDTLFSRMTEEKDKGVIGWIATIIRMMGEDLAAAIKKSTAAFMILQGWASNDDMQKEAGYALLNDTDINKARAMKAMGVDKQYRLNDNIAFTGLTAKVIEYFGGKLENNSDLSYGLPLSTEYKNNYNASDYFSKGGRNGVMGLSQFMGGAPQSTPYVAPYNVTTQNTFNIDGSKDPQAVADAVSRALDGRNNASLTNFSIP